MLQLSQRRNLFTVSNLQDRVPSRISNVLHFHPAGLWCDIIVSKLGWLQFFNEGACVFIHWGCFLILWGCTFCQWGCLLFYNHTTSFLRASDSECVPWSKTKLGKSLACETVYYDVSKHKGESPLLAIILHHTCNVQTRVPPCMLPS